MSEQNYWEKFTSGRTSRRRLLKGGAALSLGATALAIIGCGSGSNGGDSATADTSGESSLLTGGSGTPKPGGNYASTFTTVGNYNTVAFYHDGYNNSGITAYDRPMTARLDKKGYNLEAMDTIEVPDPLRVVMTMKPGMVFQNQAPVNGRKVAGTDIIATQNYVKNLPNAENSQFQRTFVDRVEAPDEQTVIYYLKQPSAYLFSSTYLANPTAQPIIPQEMLEVLDTHPAVGSGPFELTDNVFGQKYTYKKFDNFREAKNGMPYFATRETYGLSDNVALEAAFRSGQISEWTPPTTIVDRLNSELDKSKFASVQYLAVGQTGINSMMNAALGGPRPWHDVRVRQAFYQLTNRQQWVDLGYSGKAVTNPGPLQASLELYQLDPKDTDKYFKQDLTAAKQLLSAANYDTTKEWEIVVSNSVSTNAQLAEVWQQQINPAGIKVRIVSLPLAQILPQKMSVAQFDFWVGNQPGGDTPARAMRNQHSNTNDLFNNVGLYNPEVDALIEKSEATIDKDENISLVKQIQTMALDLYSLSYNAVTAQAYLYYDGRLRDFLIDPLMGQDYQYQAWLDA